MSNMIPLSGMDVVEFVPSAFEGSDEPPTFLIRVPTFSIRDKMAAILFQRGLIPATVSMGRATLIDALYDLHDEAKAEEEATFLEGYWSKADVYEQLLQGWQIREAQRIFDLSLGVKKDLPPEPVPQAPFTMRDQAHQARILADALDRHDGYRSFQARNMVMQEEEESITMRLFLLGWKNCVTRAGKGAPVVKEIKAERDDLDRLTDECVESLRQWLSDAFAYNAWDEIKAKVLEQFGAPGRLEKNSDSPLDTHSSQSGSLTSSGDLGTSDGSSTTSSTTPTPSSRSRATSGSSRASRSAKSGRSRTAGRKNGQTAEVS